MELSFEMKNEIIRNGLLSFLVCLLSFCLFLPASAALINATPTVGADSTGVVTRERIASAIAAADRLAADLAPADVSARKASWTRLYGTAGAGDALEAVQEVRDALAQLRDNWDSLSVQTLSIKTGWNAFYVYANDPAPAAAVVNPSGYAARLRARVAADFADPGEAGVVEMLTRLEELTTSYVAIRTDLLKAFGTKIVPDWPVASVHAYMGTTDADAQFTTDVSAEASASDPYLTWSAAAPDAVNPSILPAGVTYAAFSTSSVTRTVALLGTGVSAGSMSWRKSGGSDNPAEWNRLGVVTARSRLSTGAFLTDLDFSYDGLAKVYGTDPGSLAFSVAGPGNPLSVADGEVLIANASASSSWYPAPVASPSAGVTVAAQTSTATFQLKNETASAQRITGRLFRTGILGSALTAITNITYQATAMRGWERWDFDGEGGGAVFADELAAGETRVYRVKIPLTALGLAEQGRKYAEEGFQRTFSALMQFSYGSNGACTYLSVVGESSQGAVTAARPFGLWVGTMTFDKVSQVKGDRTIVHDVAAGGRMRVRAIVHVGTNGVAKLLHHVAIKTTTVTNAAGETVVQNTLYAGSAMPTAGSLGAATTLQRLDSIAMDIDNPVIEGVGSFADALIFGWTVAPNARANPFHHPYHPEHDGLTADYEKAAPDGDDMDNYRNGTVKPETWSIFNTLEFAMAPQEEPETSETVSGTCTWTFGNLRRKVNGSDLKASGTFTLQRVHRVATLVE